MFAGTASSAYAALKSGLIWLGCEKDKQVFDAAYSRLKDRFVFLYSRKELGQLEITKSTNIAKEIRKRSKGVPEVNYPTDVNDLMISGCTVDVILEDQLKNLNLEVKQTSLENCEGEEGLFSKKKIE